MRFWRKKNPEFVWQKHVRTTVLLRREKRRKKLEDAGAAAAFGIHQARWKSVAAMKAAAYASARGSKAAGRAIAKGSKASWAYGVPKVQAGGKAAGRGIQKAGVKVAAASANGARRGGAAVRHANAVHIQPAGRAARDWVRNKTRPILTKLSSPQLFGPLSIMAVVASLGAALNLFHFGATSDALFITGLAMGLLGLVILAWPTNASTSDYLPKKPTLNAGRIWRPSRRFTAITGTTCAILVGIGAVLWHYRSELPNLNQISYITLPDAVPKMDISELNPLKSEVIKGRAKAIDGGHLRIAKQKLRLDNIEALLPAQMCKTKRRRSWRCGQRAKSQLHRIIRRHRLTCTVTRKDDDGIKRGRCTAAGRDVAGELVRQGYAFANLGLFASFRKQEDEAREKNLGIWKGTAERPSDYRMARWDKAAKKAPDGCPIKGRIIRRKRLYALPWDRGYDRVRIRARRGEKWFCSERDALKAGFKPLNRI